MDTLARNQLVLEHLALVRIVATRVRSRLPASVELDELCHLGMMGLIDAVERYDARRGVPLDRYAEIRIRGAILDGLRKATWVPRAVRRRAAVLEDRRADLRLALGREPEPAELAASLGVDLEGLARLRLEAEVPTVTSLDRPVHDGDHHPLAEILPSHERSAEERWTDEEIRHGLNCAIGRLPPREGATVRLYYQDGRTLKEIGRTLGVTESRACQLRRQGVARLRRWLVAPDGALRADAA